MGKEYRTDWKAPPSNCEAYEAEWGYADGLTDDIARFAKEHGFQIKYLDYVHPEDASPLVADVYRQRNEQLRRPTDSILVESFVVMEPWLAIRYSLTPFWAVFSIKPSLERLREYLKACHGAFRNGFMILFCSGVNSVGLAGVDEWKGLLDSHFPRKERNLLLGVDESVFPKDFGVPVRYQPELAKAVGEEAQYVMPPSLGLAELERYMAQNSDHYKVHYKA
ncbi:TAP-like protein [Aspergillus sp. HF37]|nr:TAP-like protein [Aspergillus sp. HF37]